jgi:hypothetical protein
VGIMTKEVAEKIVRGITDKIECNIADIDDWAEFWGFTKEEYEEFLDMAKKALEQEPNTWNLDDAREDFMSDVYNTLEPTNNEANRIIDSFDRVTSGIKQEPILDKVRAEIKAMSGDIETIADVLDILDKYKVESEVEE